jgi:hypothetical protein
MVNDMAAISVLRRRSKSKTAHQKRQWWLRKTDTMVVCRRRYDYSSVLLAIVVALIVCSSVTVLHVGASSQNKEPIALHQLYELPLDDDSSSNGGQHGIVISLEAVVFTSTEKTITATITSLPQFGQLYHVSQVYATHGYDPKKGKVIDTVPMNITSSRIEVVYDNTSTSRPSYHTSSYHQQHQTADSFSYTVTTSDNSHPQQTRTSLEGTVALVPSESRKLASSTFIIDAEGWTTTGNRRGNEVRHERNTRGAHMSHYVYASDDSVNININHANSAGGGRDDMDLWYFLAPSPTFTSWQVMAYGGTLQFTLASFSGDYSETNMNYQGSNTNLNLVKIKCASCNYGKGVTIGCPLSQIPQAYNGSPQKFVLRMHESAGWVKDPKNTLVQWTRPTKCEFLEVLSGITSLEILGDFTKGYETTALDDVAFLVASSSDKQPIKGRLHLPVCAQQLKARKCTCKEDRTTNLHKYS